jgi:hypothetical protein
VKIKPKRKKIRVNIYLLIGFKFCCAWIKRLSDVNQTIRRHEWVFNSSFLCRAVADWGERHALELGRLARRTLE